MMNIRRYMVEHPFGILKTWMGWSHFLTKRQDNVSIKMSLHVLSHNMKRLINMFGVGMLLEKLALLG
jgi:transposase